MKNIKKILINITAFLIVFMLLVTPVLSFAYNIRDPIVPPCPATGCGWNEFLMLINNVIYFILYGLAMPIAAIMFAYAGVLLVQAQGGEAKTKAKEIFLNAVYGLAIAAAAWLIVKTLLAVLGYKDAAWIGF